MLKCLIDDMGAQKLQQKGGKRASMAAITFGLDEKRDNLLYAEVVGKWKWVWKCVDFWLSPSHILSL